ncbi:cytochrome P450 [Streptomyces bambusae]|uniref:cytochrome P450 n=1 Tax=Streptomyces bambusae TaxID=1550616 RepID=UPI001CFEA85C|nr:cytochrome P450 [Streptomyces bambusae]MCB5165673.1 cytochrome P450 [Streptomyces bambusae]
MDSGRSPVLLPERTTFDEEAQALLRRLLETDIRADPYPLFNRIRAHGPVWMNSRTVVFSSRADCEAVLQAPGAGTSGACPGLHGPAAEAAFPESVADLLAGPDPVEHGRLRRLMSHYFTPWAVRDLAPQLRGLVDDLLDSVASRGRLEVVTDLAYPLSMASISRVLGIPAADRGWLHRRALTVSRSLDPHLALTGQHPPGLDERRTADAELGLYFAELVRMRRAAPGDDLVSALIAAEDKEAGPVGRDAAAVCRLLLDAGYETTVNLISGGVLALLRDPALLARVRRDPAYAEQVVEDVLCTDPPVQLVHRHAAAEMRVGDTVVPRGTVMVLLLAAAHRDPGQEADGGALRHLAFGLGAHSCIGSPQARLEVRLMLARFAQRVSGARFATGRPTYRPNVTLRGLRALWVDADDFGSREVPWPVRAG